MPGITLCIPFYRAHDYADSVLEGVFAQTRAPDAILVIDDGSPKPAADSIHDDRVRIIRHKTNRGLSAARNTALQETTTEFIAFLDADCRPDPAWLQTLERVLEVSDAIAAGGKLIEFHQKTCVDRWRGVHMRQHWGYRARINPPWLFGNNWLARCEPLRDIGGWNEAFRTNMEDVDMSRRLLAAGHNLLYEPAAVVRHLRTDTRASLFASRYAWTHPPQIESIGEVLHHLIVDFARCKYFGLCDFFTGRLSLLWLDTVFLFYSWSRDFRRGKR